MKALKLGDVPIAIMSEILLIYAHTEYALDSYQTVDTFTRPICYQSIASTTTNQQPTRYFIRADDLPGGGIIIRRIVSSDAWSDV